MSMETPKTDALSDMADALIRIADALEGIRDILEDARSEDGGYIDVRVVGHVQVDT